MNTFKNFQTGDLLKLVYKLGISATNSGVWHAVNCLALVVSLDRFKTCIIWLNDFSRDSFTTGVGDYLFEKVTVD